MSEYVFDEATRKAIDDHNAKWAELRALFDGDNINVRPTYNPAIGAWQVSICVSEEGVRRLAELMRQFASPTPQPLPKRE